MTHKIISFRAYPTDLEFISRALIEEAGRSGMPLPTQTGTLRAALYHFWIKSTAEQRAVAWQVTRGVRGPMDLTEDPEKWAAQRDAAETELE